MLEICQLYLLPFSMYWVHLSTIHRNPFHFFHLHFASAQHSFLSFSHGLYLISHFPPATMFSEIIYSKKLSEKLKLVKIHQFLPVSFRTRPDIQLLWLDHIISWVGKSELCLVITYSNLIYDIDSVANAIFFIALLNILSWVVVLCECTLLLICFVITRKLTLLEHSLVLLSNL